MNIYCFSTLSFAKLQFKSVINKAFHKHGVASFTDAWIETALPDCCNRRATSRIFYRCVDWNSVLNVSIEHSPIVASFTDAWIETRFAVADLRRGLSHLLQMRGLKPSLPSPDLPRAQVASFTDAWIETHLADSVELVILSHLLQMRGLKQIYT